MPLIFQVVNEQSGCHHHRNGDEKTIGGFHLFRLAKEENHGNTSCVKNPIDTGNVQLPLLIGRIFRTHLRPEVEVDGLTDQGE